MSRTAFLTYSISTSGIRLRCVVSKRRAAWGMPRQAEHRNLAGGPSTKYSAIWITEVGLKRKIIWNCSLVSKKWWSGWYTRKGPGYTIELNYTPIQKPTCFRWHFYWLSQRSHVNKIYTMTTPCPTTIGTMDGTQCFCLNGLHWHWCFFFVLVSFFIIYMCEVFIKLYVWLHIV